VASTRRTPPPPPLEGNDRLITQAITAGWAVALIVLLIVRDSLPPGERWWVWTAVSGLVLGGFGLLYVPHLQRRRAETAGRRAQAREAGLPAAEAAAETQDSPLNDSNTVSSSETPGRSTRS
jgi:hypothetical protein